jgi:hypothetical protein
MRHPFDQEALLCAAYIVEAGSEEKLSDNDIATVVVGMDSYIQAAWDSLCERKLVDYYIGAPDVPDHIIVSIKGHPKKQKKARQLTRSGGLSYFMGDV